MDYTSDVVLGERYRDEQTGLEGVATSVTFFQHACERIGLETYDGERLKLIVTILDAPRLVSIKTGEAAESSKPGGDRDDMAARDDMGAHRE